jgi:hypothetical protein
MRKCKMCGKEYQEIDVTQEWCLECEAKVIDDD